MAGDKLRLTNGERKALFPLTLERLKSVLHYNPDTGLWTWLVTLGSRAPKGTVTAGCPSKRGDLQIRVDHCLYKAHHLAWFYMTGTWPKPQIDHDDRNRANNRWKNLREATNSQNGANKTGLKGTGTGIKNVSCVHGYGNRRTRYIAYGSTNQKRVYVGSFDTLDEASAAAFAHAKKEYGEFAHA